MLIVTNYTGDLHRQCDAEKSPLLYKIFARMNPSRQITQPAASTPPPPPVAIQTTKEEVWGQLETKKVRLRALFCAMPSPRQKISTRITAFIYGLITHVRAQKRSARPWLRIPPLPPFPKPQNPRVLVQTRGKFLAKIGLQGGHYWASIMLSQRSKPQNPCLVSYRVCGRIKNCALAARKPGWLQWRSCPSSMIPRWLSRSFLP